MVVLFWYTITKTKSILVLGHNIWYTITKTNTKSIDILYLKPILEIAQVALPKFITNIHLSVVHLVQS